MILGAYLHFIYLFKLIQRKNIMPNTLKSVIRLIVQFTMLLLVFLMLPENAKLAEDFTTLDTNETPATIYSAQSESNKQRGMIKISYPESLNSENSKNNTM